MACCWLCYGVLAAVRLRREGSQGGHQCWAVWGSQPALALAGSIMLWLGMWLCWQPGQTKLDLDTLGDQTRAEHKPPSDSTSPVISGEPKPGC